MGGIFWLLPVGCNNMSAFVCVGQRLIIMYIFYKPQTHADWRRQQINADACNCKGEFARWAVFFGYCQSAAIICLRSSASVRG
jgi:hypothetical protein